MIEYVNVHKSFDTPVLGGVDLTVKDGEMLGLVGPSGTGKSVLLKTTIALVTPDRGDVRVGGESVFHSRSEVLERIRREVGYVFQHAALFDSMSVFDNIVLGLPEDEVRTTSHRELALRAAGALEHVKLDAQEVLPKLPAELSGGMKKRVGIARAIVGRPEILLWDEPTTGLDPMNLAAVERLIDRLSEELRVTSVIVTHDIEGALGMCDRVALLEGGRIRFCGVPDAFRASEDPVVQAFVDRNAAYEALDVLEVT